MQKDKSHTGNLEGDSYRELRLLEEVDSTPELSQRHLARSLGIALGVANLLVRTLVKKGESPEFGIIAVSAIVVTALLLTGALYFRRVQHTFADVI